jgi:PAS domain S-box-containing protein
MIFIKDAQTLQFVRFNRAGEELLGYSRNDLQGKNDYDFFPQNEADFFTRKDREVLRGGEIVDIPEESIMTSGKGLRTLHTKKVPLLDDNGKPEYMLGISEDITEKKQIEAERERLLSAIEQTGEMVVVMDKEAVIQYVNPAFTSVTGYTRQEVVGQTIHILESHQQDEEFYRELWAKVSGGDTFKGRMINRRRDGSLYTEDMSISPVFNSEGNIAGYVSVGRDVTDEIRMAAQLLQAQKMEAVGRLAGGVAHDFNNMLAVILGHAEMAMNKVDPSHPSYAEFETIRKAADRSADLTRQLLAFARKQTIVPKILELNDTLEGMLKMLRRLIGEEINLVFKPGADLPPIKMDPGQIDQLLANLCLNARDAISGHGRITIETSKIALDETHCAKQEGCVPGEFVRLTVSDDGCGIARETLENIFEPFFTTKGLGRGTGLGLATVYGIVKQNRGIINVYSEPGMGSIFNIYLPACSGPDDLPQGKPQGEIPRGNGERVLLVEDEPALIKMAKDLLEMIGYVVLPSESTIEAERLAEEYAGRVDLLMTDVIMPERDGRELAKLLQSRYPGMKCLFMSGYTSDVIDRHGVLEEGMHFIQKPFSISDLAVKVKTALGKS